MISDSLMLFNYVLGNAKVSDLVIPWICCFAVATVASVRDCAALHGIGVHSHATSTTRLVRSAHDVLRFGHWPCDTAGDCMS